MEAGIEIYKAIHTISLSTARKCLVLSHQTESTGPAHSGVKSPHFLVLSPFPPPNFGFGTYFDPLCLSELSSHSSVEWELGGKGGNPKSLLLSSVALGNVLGDTQPHCNSCSVS